MTPSKNARRLISKWQAAIAASLMLGAMHASAIDLADTPLFSTSGTPGNLLLSLSVEWPTANTPAYLSTTPYSAANTYVGYFDAAKCYRYTNYTAPNTAADGYFEPASMATSHACTTTAANPLWSGNYLNWASTQTLDAFRWALTGGDRVIDTTTLTVVEKTRHSGQGDRTSIYPDKTLSTGVSGATPFTFTSVATRIFGMGTTMAICSGNCSGSTAFTRYTNQSSAAGTASSTAYYQVNIRVKVCDSTVGVEDNCTQYGSNYKPEGLIQQYAMKLRYSAFGYLNDSTIARDGGVMRARMKYVGPQTPIPGSSSIPNPITEWDGATGIMNRNPDSLDANATTAASTAAGYTVTITNSGVINYLNRFGKVETGDYKSYDPVSELYYAGQRYFRNLGNVPEYSSLSGAGSLATMKTWLDGFPVITNWDDPILYSCQKNFIIGIGDVNTHRDKNLRGSTMRTDEPAVPAAVASDTSVDVVAATNMVGKLEGISSTLGSTLTGSGNTASYFIAGLAYDAHTGDIRPDLTGKQTISTYWLDVMEGQTYKSKNQYWLAAKYGGFEVPDTFSPYATTNTTTTLPNSSWWTTNELTPSPGDKRPDNYFLANQADKMVDGLKRAFAKIITENDNSTTTAFSTPTAKVSSTDGASYAASYEPKTWSGIVNGSTLTFATDGTPTTTLKWDARALLDATTSTNRKIVTCCTSTGTALPFRATNLNSATLISRTNYSSFSAVPGVTGTQSSSNYVSYLRGDTSQQLANGGIYRNRTHLLGDVSGSKANPVGPPSAVFFDQTNPGYGAFKRAQASRKTVVYVGANDGMMHAFDGTMPGSTACSTCGTELFAYIPSFAYQGSDNNASTTGLASYGNPNFVHHFFVDATPQNFDVDFKNTAGSTATANDWRTVLIGGLGKGGKGYYAIDVTDPTSWTSETAVAGKVLWEFTDSRMGYSYGDASVVKTAKYGWVVIFTSGYNNSDGKGYFFIVNPRTGALLEAVATPEGSTAAPLDMAHHTAFIPDYTDFTADAVYAGDLRGNVWRLDLTGKTGTYAAPTKIAVLTNASATGNLLPVTTRPLIEIDPNSKKRYVLIGTGRLLADSDINSTQRQAFYAIIDGTAAAGTFYTSATLPSGVTFPATRANLNANTDPLTGIGSAPANPMGWYVDLGPSTGGVAERINVTPVANVGLVAIGVNLPGGSACAPGGTSYGLGLSFGDGKTVLVNASGTLISASPSDGGLITDVGILNVGGKIRAVLGRSTGTLVAPPITANAGLSLKRLNWREVPTAD